MTESRGRVRGSERWTNRSGLTNSDTGNAFDESIYAQRPDEWSGRGEALLRWVTAQTSVKLDELSLDFVPFKIVSGEHSVVKQSQRC